VEVSLVGWYTRKGKEEKGGEDRCREREREMRRGVN